MSSIHGCRRGEGSVILRLSFLIAALVLLGQAAAPGTTIIPVTDRELYQRADVIVHGVVLSSEVQEVENGMIETVSVVRPFGVVKGSLGGDLVLHQIGGRLRDGRFVQIWGRPEYTPGREVVVFAIARTQGDFQTAEMMLGKFEVHQDERFSLFAVPDRVLQSHPGVTWQRPAPRKLDREDASSRGEDGAEGFEADRPRELAGFLAYLSAGASGVCESAEAAQGALRPVEHPEAVRLHAAPEWGNIGNSLWRYTNNATAVWTFSGTANITGGGPAESQGAVNAWTNNPNSAINYTLGAGSSNLIQLNALSSPCGWSTCISGSGVIGCGGPNGGDSNSWRGDNYSTITGGTVWLRSYCSMNGFSSVTTQAVLTHELGHTLGLGHSDQNVSSHDVCRGDESVAQMRSSVQGFTALGTDDQDAIRWLYGDGLNSCSATPTVSSLTPSPAPPWNVGTTITWTATATGGTAPLQYEFLLYTGATATWSVARGYSTTNSWSWTPSQVGQYAVQVWVRSNGSTASYDAWMGSGFFNITSAGGLPTITSLTASLTLPQQAGTPITWTATATGVTAPLQYQFLLYTGATANWSVSRAYSTSNTWSWTPSQAGQYAVQVWVRNNGSATAYDAWRGSGFFTIGTSGGAPTITSLAAGPALPQAAGTAITWTAMATGGTAPLQYQFLLYSGASGTWSVARAYSTSNTWAWTPSQAGQYAVQTWVRNNGSAASYDTWTGSGFFNISP